MREKNGHLPCCAKLAQDPNNKISLFNVSFWPGACRASENIDCYLKIITKICVKTFLKLAARRECTVFFNCLKSKKRRDTQQNFKFPLCPGRNLFTLRTYKINSKQISISNFLFGNCSLKKKKDICRFSHKYLFISPCGFFWELKLIELLKIYPIGSNVSNLENRKIQF